jgi:hypothetical protein
VPERDIRNLPTIFLVALNNWNLLWLRKFGQNLVFHGRQMLRFTTTIFFFAVAVSAFAQAPADLATKKASLIALERMWNQAQVNRDAPAIASMIGNHFINTEFDGEVSSRGKFLEDFADPQFKPSLMNITNVEVEFYNVTAVVTGDYHTKGTSGGKPYDHNGRFTDTWIFQDGKWLCVASHSSLVKK